jgi:hypothetical protein
VADQNYRIRKHQMASLHFAAAAVEVVEVEIAVEVVVTEI